MKSLQFWFDPISPYACLGFDRLPQALEGLSYSVDYRPILFAGLLKTWGQKGPAEIEPKRAWTFRQIAWQAHRLGVRIETPAQHPFNPLALLRLLHACAPEGGMPNRWQCEQVFHHVWHGGADANEAQRVAELRARLAPARDPDGEAVKQSVKDSTAAALARGVFGVPTIEVDGRLFWGLDSLDMLAAFLRGDAWFDGPDWDAAATPRPGIARR